MRTTTVRRVLARLLASFAVLATAGVVTAATAQPASAAACATKAHVYVITGGVFPKYEDQPINGDPYQLYVNVTGYGTGTFELGGNGLLEDEDPFWDLYDGTTGAYEGTFVNTRTNGNCVSNQRRYYVGRYEGDSVLVKATYQSGNSGATIAQQVHFKLNFI
jgi:hypothetical protein